MPTGPSTGQSPYLVPLNERVSFTSILSAGDTVSGSNIPGTTTPWRMAGTPDGIGAFDNGDGTMTVVFNHEFTPNEGIVRAHGAMGSFVDRIVIDKATLRVVSAGDLVTSGSNVFTWDATTSSYTAGPTAWNRFCSSDLPALSAIYDATTGLGTQSRLYFTGEETGPEGRPFAFIASGANVGKVYEIPRLGNMAFENIALNPGTGAKTVAMMQDDQSPTTSGGITYGGGQVYVYVGDKQASGTDVDKAGLNNGKLFGIVVPALGTGAAANETNATNFESGTPFTVAMLGNNGDVSGMTGAQLQADSEAKGVAEFLRPEDGAWDPSNPNRYYFHTTNAITSPSRLWALDFVDAKDPTKGGTLRELLNGTEGHVMLDNMTVTQDGKLILQEDPGNNARVSKVWLYDPTTDTLSQLAEHDPARFSGLTPPFTQDEESSGVIDVSAILGSPGKQVFLLDVQAHYAFGDPAIVEGGQLMAMTLDRSIVGSVFADTLVGGVIDDVLTGLGGADILTGGAGTDLFRDTRSGLSGDTITDLSRGETIDVTDVDYGAFGYQRLGAALNLGSGPALTLAGNPVGRLVLSSDAVAGTKLTLSTHWAGLNDFNADGHSDLLWRNVNTGVLTTWGISGNAVANQLQQNTYLNGSVGKDWRVEGTMDFNGDGASDIVWRNVNNGAFTIWSSTAAGFTQNTYQNESVANNWSLAGFGDFNGDGRDDILWRNSSGQFTEWQSTGTGFTANVYSDTTVGNDWRIVATGDFDGDGRTDILWRSTGGGLTTWSSTGNGFTPNTYSNSTVGTAWHIAAVGDFNGDGRDDLLWRNDNGQFTEWQSTGRSFTPNVYSNTSVNNSWHIQGVFDFNDDGRADILWRNDDGAATVWQSTGNGFTPNTLTIGSVGPDWQVMTHHYDFV